MAASLDLLLARPLVFGPLLALFAALLVAFIRKARAHPINDICTDPSAPLEFVKARLAYHPKFAQIQKRLYPSMQPLELPQGDARTWPVFLAACRALAEARGFEIVAIDAPTARVQMLCITRLMRFRDDMVLQLKDGKVQIRSKSRLGRGDLGANSVRITDALQFINNYVKTKSKL